MAECAAESVLATDPSRKHYCKPISTSDAVWQKLFFVLLRELSICSFPCGFSMFNVLPIWSVRGCMLHQHAQINEIRRRWRDDRWLFLIGDMICLSSCCTWNQISSICLVCLPACLPANLSVYMSVYLSICLFVCLFACLSVYLSACLLLSVT